MRQGITWKLERGDRISLWFDNWIGNYNLVEKLNFHENNVSLPEATVCDFILTNRNWNTEKLNRIHNNNPIRRKIQGITIPIHDMDDSYCCGLNSL